MRQNNIRGQVAVEFLIMFILSASLLFYIFYFAVSLSALQYKQYVTYMVARAITSSSPTYAEKGARASMIKSMFDVADGSKNLSATWGASQCSINDSSTGFRNIMKYYGGAEGLDYSIFSTAGIACSVDMNQVLPGILSGSSGKLSVAVESMTGSEISEAHCKCLLSEFNSTWLDCINDTGNYNLNGVAIDNGC
ncbi:MAG: hypothetical protein WCQ47_01160 [bacterium]